jgi:hypothetical protein
MRSIRDRIRDGRRRGSASVRLLDLVRELATAPGRARLYVKAVHGRQLHQITEYSEADRYPELFDLTAQLRPQTARILSFGCSTGEEIEAIRLRHPSAMIVGCEINPRSRKLARKRLAGDSRVRIVPNCAGEDKFDIVFAMAVLQYQPHRIQAEGITDIGGIYPFSRFEEQVTTLTAMLNPGGLLCVMHTQYRAEDTGAAGELQPIAGSPGIVGLLFRPDGRIYEPAPKSLSLFEKRRGRQA